MSSESEYTPRSKKVRTEDPISEPITLQSLMDLTEYIEMEEYIKVKKFIQYKDVYDAEQENKVNGEAEKQRIDYYRCEPYFIKWNENKSRYEGCSGDKLLMTSHVPNQMDSINNPDNRSPFTIRIN